MLIARPRPLYHQLWQFHQLLIYKFRTHFCTDTQTFLVFLQLFVVVFTGQTLECRLPAPFFQQKLRPSLHIVNALNWMWSSFPVWTVDESPSPVLPARTTPTSATCLWLTCWSWVQSWCVCLMAAGSGTRHLRLWLTRYHQDLARTLL